jgi:hypothetical protein
MKKLLLCCALFLLASCTSNVRAKQWGGTTELKLPPCVKLVNVTWKDANLWYLTRPMRDGEQPEKWLFDEDSNFGIMTGKINIIEQACPTGLR